MSWQCLQIHPASKQSHPVTINLLMAVDRAEQWLTRLRVVCAQQGVRCSPALGMGWGDPTSLQLLCVCPTVGGGSRGGAGCGRSWGPCTPGCTGLCIHWEWLVPVVASLWDKLRHRQLSHPIRTLGGIPQCLSAWLCTISLGKEPGIPSLKVAVMLRRGTRIPK